MREYNILLFKVKDRLFGINAEEIHEVMEYKNNGSGSDKITLTYLGDVLEQDDETCFDGKNSDDNNKINYDESKKINDNKKIIVSNYEEGQRGYIVDEVVQLLRVAETSVRRAPRILLTEKNKFLDNFCIVNELLFPIINLSKLSALHI
ncbi:MAG TPA: hypothetical protein GXX37_04515 [Clostridiaceae bacterium]|nr:hypothetical protein [Clostridiaceae bacterium]